MVQGLCLIEAFDKATGEQGDFKKDFGFQQAVGMAASQLRDTQRPTAAGHIQSAIKALSERPYFRVRYATKAMANASVSWASSALLV
jgi:hypothetical protein